MGLDYADENLRFCLSDTAKQVPVSHAGIDQDDNCPDLEKSKGKCNKLKGRSDHQHDPVASAGHPVSDNL